MHYLPEQQGRILRRAMTELLTGGSTDIQQPCNCGGQVRHNNGGNYHSIIEARVAEDGQILWRDGSTSDYDDSDWERIELAKLYDILRERIASW